MSKPVVIKSADDLVPAVQWAGDNPKARWYVARMARAFKREDLIPEEWGTEEIKSFREQTLSSEEDLHRSAAIDKAVDAFVDTVEDLKDGAVDQTQAETLVASILAQADRGGVFDETFDAIIAGAALYVEDAFITAPQMEALLASADKIRRVRTQAGVRRFKAPVGTPIIRDPRTGLLKADKSKIKLDADGKHADVPESEKPATKHVLTAVSDIEEGDEVTNKDGKTFVVGTIRKTDDGKIKLTVEGEGGEIESYELPPTSRVKVAVDEADRPKIDPKGIADRRKADEENMDAEIARLKARGDAGDKAAAAEARTLAGQRREQKSLGKDAKDAKAAVKREPIKRTAPDETARTRGKNSHAVTFKDGDKDVTGEFWSDGPVAKSAWVQTDDGPVAVKIGSDGKLTKLNYEMPTKDVGPMPTGEEKAKALDILKRRNEHAEYEYAKTRRTTWSSPATRKPEPDSEKPTADDIKFAEQVASREQVWANIADKAREDRGKPKLSEKDLDTLMPNRKSDDPELTLDDLQAVAEAPKKPEPKAEEKAPTQRNVERAEADVKTAREKLDAEVNRQFPEREHDRAVANAPLSQRGMTNGDIDRGLAAQRRVDKAEQAAARARREAADAAPQTNHNPADDRNPDNFRAADSYAKALEGFADTRPIDFEMDYDSARKADKKAGDDNTAAATKARKRFAMLTAIGEDYGMVKNGRVDRNIGASTASLKDVKERKAPKPAKTKSDAVPLTHTRADGVEVGNQSGLNRAEVEARRAAIEAEYAAPERQYVAGDDVQDKDGNRYVVVSAYPLEVTVQGVDAQDNPIGGYETFDRRELAKVETTPAAADTSLHDTWSTDAERKASQKNAAEAPTRQAEAKARAQAKRDAAKAEAAKAAAPEAPAAAEPEKPKGDGKVYRVGRGYQQWTVASENEDGTVNLVPAEGSAPVSGKARNRNKVDRAKLVEMKDPTAAPTPLAATQSEAAPADDKKLSGLKDSTGNGLSTSGSYNLGRGYQKWKITSVNGDGTVNVEPVGGGDGTRKRWNIKPEKLIPLDAQGNKPEAPKRGRPKVAKRSEDTKLATKAQLEKMQERLAEPTAPRTREDVARSRAKAAEPEQPATPAVKAEPEPPKPEDFSNHSDYKLTKAEEDARSVIWQAENVRDGATPEAKAAAESTLAAIRAERKRRAPAPVAKPEEKPAAAPAKGMSPRVLNALIKAEEARSAGIQTKINDGSATADDRAELRASEEQLTKFRGELNAGQAAAAQKARTDMLDAKPVAARRSREEVARDEAARIKRNEEQRAFFADKQDTSTGNEWEDVDDDTVNALLQGYIAEGELDHADTQSLLKERRERDGRWAGTADDFASLTDTEVDTKIQEAAAAGNWVELDDLYGERTARGEDNKSAALNSRIQELVANGRTHMEAEAEATGVPLEKLQKNEAIRWMRETYNLEIIQSNRFEELLSNAYKQELGQEIDRAEDAAGHLYSPEGYQRMKNQDKEVLWMQAERVAYANASKELKEYWETHGRLTKEQFRQRVMEAAGKRGADYQYSNAGNMR